jgi:hypothetical protein
MPGASTAIGLFGRDGELAAAADFHSGNAVLPARYQPTQREFDRLPAAEGAVEFLTGVVLDTGVMHLDRAAGDCLRPVADDDVFDGELGGRRPGREVDLGFVCHLHHASGHTDDVAEDNDTLTRINKLVGEEKDLRAKLQRGEISGDEEHARLRTVETELDQCWDLLRQRRALRETGGDPKDAHVRSADQVEGYLN